MQATIVFQKNWTAIHEPCPECSTGVNGCNWCLGTGRKYKYIINSGSSRSSKTASLIQVCDLYCRSYAKKRVTVWRDTKKDCKDTVLHDAKGYLKMWGNFLVGQTFNKTESVFTYDTESTYEFHGTDDEEKVMGLNKDVAHLNEPYKISLDTFNQIDMRTADFVIIDLNPKKGHWSDDLVKDKRAIVIHSTFRDNPFCPENQKIKILSYQPVSMSVAVEEIMKDGESRESSAQIAINYDCVDNPNNYSPKLIKELARCQENERNNSASPFNWSVYGLGEKAEKPNRIFSWKKIQRQKYDEIQAIEYYANDWGKVDPWGIIAGKYYDGTLYLRELNYDSENDLRAKMSIEEQTEINNEDQAVNVHEIGSVGIVSWMYNRIRIPKEAFIVCDSNRPGKIAWLRRCGWINAMPASKLPGSIIDGIELLSDIEVCYTDDSPNIEMEQENYSYKTDRYGIVLEEPEDKDNHLTDPARYLAQYLRTIGVIKVK